MTTQAKRKDAALDGIASACHQQEFPAALIEEILAKAGELIACYELGDPVAQRREAMRAHMEAHYPDLMREHREGIENFIMKLSGLLPERWGNLNLMASAMYSGFINYRDADSQVDVARSDDLIDRMEKSGLIDISYTFVEEDEDGEEGDFIEIEKADIPPVGEAAYSPLTGELEPNFHNMIVRHFMIGKPLKSLFVAA